MRYAAVAAATWIFVAVLLAAIGLLVVTGLGRTRGSPLYRLRMSLWSAALAAAAGAGIVIGAGCANRGGVPDEGQKMQDVGSVETAVEKQDTPAVPDVSEEEEDEAVDTADEATAKPEAEDGTVTKKKPRVVTKMCYAIVSGGDTAEYKAAVKKVIAKNVGPIRSCYEKALLQTPDLEGKIVVKFVISPGGTVQSAAIEKDGVGSPELAACVLSRIKTLKFPLTEGGTAIMTHPFVFRAPKN